MRKSIGMNLIRPERPVAVSGPAMQASKRRLELADESWQLDENLQIRREAEGMLHYLLVQSDKVALLIESQWLPNMVRCAFVHETLFREVAEKGGCVIHTQSIPEDGGIRHMLFLGRDLETSDGEYLKCVPVRLPE